MSAVPTPPAAPSWPPGLRLVPMRPAMLDAVLAVERTAYEFPWTRDNFATSMASGYIAECLFDPIQPDHLLGYYLLQPGVDEMHLLNLTVAPPMQRQGLGRRLLEAACVRCLQHDSPRLWLEVRVSNAAAIALYEGAGFVRVGLRRGYYPAAGGREDGIVMTRHLLDPTRSLHASDAERA